jgi:hypothetical protein
MTKRFQLTVNERRVEVHSHGVTPRRLARVATGVKGLLIITAAWGYLRRPESRQA